MKEIKKGEKVRLEKAFLDAERGKRLRTRFLLIFKATWGVGGTRERFVYRIAMATSRLSSQLSNNKAVSIF